MTGFFDTHTHLQLREFDADRPAVIGRARAAGVRRMLVLGVDLATSQEAVSLARSQEGLLAAAGCHPHDAKLMTDGSWEGLEALAASERVVAVGEIGLDFYRDLSPRDVQIAAFKRQLALATTLAKPVAVHCREAHDEMLPILESWSRACGAGLPDGRPLGLMHHFSGDADLAERYVEFGFLVSIHCSVTYPNAQRLQSVASLLPLDKIVVETDSPFGPPQSHRGQRNEPSFLVEAVARIAALRGVSSEAVAEATTSNALRLFAPIAAATAGTQA